MSPRVPLPYMVRCCTNLSKEVRVDAASDRDGVLICRCPSHRLASQSGRIPHPQSLVERRGDDQVVARVKRRAHHVVVVPREHRDARARLPVPDADRLVVRRRHYPRVLVVELDCTDVVEVAEQREETAPEFVVPHLRARARLRQGGRWGGVRNDHHSSRLCRCGADAASLSHFDLVVISARHKQRLAPMEVDTANGPVVLLIPVKQDTHPVVPQLHDAIVQRREHVRARRVEGQPLDPAEHERNEADSVRLEGAHLRKA